MAFKNSQAQTCSGVSTEPVPVTDHPSNLNRYFTVKATLNRAYNQDVTVTGSIDAPTLHGTYTLIITAGALTAETSTEYRQPLSDNLQPTTTVTFVTPCPSTPATEYEYITQDQYFLNYVNATSGFITNVDSTTTQDFTDEALNTALANITNESTDQDIANAFTAQGFNGTQIASQLRQQLIALNNLATTNTGLSNMTWQQRQQAISNAINEYYHNQEWNPNNLRVDDACAQAYADGMDDCSSTYSWSIALSAVAGAGGAIFGTPGAGAFFWFTGAGISYGQFMSCKQSVVRNWRQCRATHPIR